MFVFVVSPVVSAVVSSRFKTDAARDICGHDGEQPLDDHPPRRGAVRHQSMHGGARRRNEQRA
jgi:hypothetical protein